ncbi:MAG TPA: hypothetical protein VMZ11_08325 [Mycobacteriales bacterium]|nr:hypothetical protein [Mycobacteriales bacterium]
MNRPVVLAVAASLVLSVPVVAVADNRGQNRGTGVARGLAASMTDHAVHLTWQGQGGRVDVRRDGRVIARVAATARRYDDRSAAPQATHTYQVGSSRPVRVRTPDYLVGAATADITPQGVVNLGGFGLGDGSLIPDAVAGRGDRGSAKDERIKVRATVVDDGRTAVAVANIEVQGWFAAYEDGKQGLADMAAEIARRVPRLPVSHIVLASDHSHSAPDTLGVWGGPSRGYLDLVKYQVISAVTQAYAHRGYADLRAGHSDASDLVYNQSCSEALNQEADPAYPGPDVCATPGKDGMVRVVQATSPSGRHPLTFMAYAAHATAGGGNGIHGDWPQFVSDELSRRYGGVGLAMVGALGGTQPCRSACSFTKRTNPGYGVKDRKTAIVRNYTAHVTKALASARRVHGPVAAAQGFIREPIVGPAVTALFAAGQYAGARLLRNHEPPWVNAQTIRTVVGALRIGDVVIAATPGEAFPRIRQDVQDAVGSQAIEVISLGLANDQLGYLISPASYVPIIAAEVPVNDNIIFNVSPTIGDHVACADIALVGRLRLRVSTPPECAPYDVEDSLGDPLAAVPFGGVVVP